MTTQSNAIEHNVEQDVIDRLTAASVTNPQHADELQESPSMPLVSVQAVAVPDTEMSAGQVPGGFYRVDVTLDCQTDIDDDKDRSALAVLVESVRDGLLLDDILALLNAASTYNTFWGLSDGAPDPSTEGRIHHHALSMTFQVSPISENTTTTTTTTTTTGA